MQYITAYPQGALWALLILMFLLTACRQWGTLTVPAMPSAESRLFAAGCGLILLSLIVLAGGSLGFVSRKSAVIAAVIFILLSLYIRRSRLGSVGAGARILLSPAAIPVSGAIFLALIAALAPPIGNDELVYHLAHPAEFIRKGSVSAIAFTRESLWPYQTEMLYLLGLLLQGTALAKLFHWVYFPLCAGLVYALAARYYGPVAGRWSALVFVFTPAVFAQAGYAYVDLPLAFYLTASLFAFLLRQEIGLGRAAVLSGFLCAGALSAKYLALVPAAILSLMWLCGSAQRLKSFILFTATAASVSAVWYVRSWAVLGNPVYPFLQHYFGGSGFATDITGDGMGHGILSFALLLWNMTFFPGSFGGENLGPLYLMLLPLLLLQGRRPRAVSLWLCFYVLAYALMLFVVSQQIRFFIPILPILSVGCGVVIARQTERGGFLAKWVWVVVAATCCLTAAMYVYRVRDALPVVIGLTSPQTYLAKRERSYEGYRYLSESLKAGQRVFNTAEPRRFYNPGIPMVYNSLAFRTFLKNTSQTLAQYLDKEQFDVIWMLNGANPDALRYVQSRPYKPAHAYSFQEGGTRYAYTLYFRVTSRE